MGTRISLPHEHGGSLTALGAAAAGVAIAPEVLPALGVGLAVTGAFFARGPVDRLVVRSPLRPWDRPALALLAVCMAAGVFLVARVAPIWGAVTGGLCVAMVGGSAAARRARKQRDPIFETLGMLGLGASGGLAALAAGAPLSLAAAAAVVLAVHASVAVPLVRSELRRRERVHERRGVLVGAAGVLAGTLAVLAIGPAAAALALAPRASYLAVRAVRRPVPARPAVVGIRETTLLALCVTLLALAT